MLVEIEQAVRRFPRYHRYAIGADLRRQAMAVYRMANRAWRDRANQASWVRQLVWDVDDLKQHLQTAKLLHAYSSFRQFEMLARLAEQLGAQAGGWHRQQQSLKVQNAPARDGFVQRDQKLSTRAASAGANP
ncbi:four helix bundle protein [Xanthomonas sacchari]|uniref:four helix bundle protein n=1 Tax=Xanthomonas sacchari TaxID=56458 RepID=UPI00225E3CD6|nr:four helix bundle protein [Xanthomonas sacchari]UYK82277.1 four helix bundle protein [Xanthomonas sacchari]